MKTAKTTTAFGGPFGYRANGLEVEQVCMLVSGAIHQVAYNATKTTIPGAFVENWNPDNERLYTYGQVRRACQKARTEERLYGTMSLVGPAGGMTKFAVELGRMKSISVKEWVEKLTFEGVDGPKMLADHILLYAEVND